MEEIKPIIMRKIKRRKLSSYKKTIKTGNIKDKTVINNTFRNTSVMKLFTDKAIMPLSI
jgi:hypothetical protein